MCERVRTEDEALVSTGGKIERDKEEDEMKTSLTRSGGIIRVQFSAGQRVP